MPPVSNGRWPRTWALLLDHVCLSGRKLLQFNSMTNLINIYLFLNIFLDCFNRKLSGLQSPVEKLITQSDSVILQKRSITWSQLLANTEKSRSDGSKKKGSKDATGDNDASEPKQAASTSAEDTGSPDPEKPDKGKDAKSKVIINLRFCFVYS